MDEMGEIVALEFIRPREMGFRVRLGSNPTKILKLLGVKPSTTTPPP